MGLPKRMAAKGERVIDGEQTPCQSILSSCPEILVILVTRLVRPQGEQAGYKVPSHHASAPTSILETLPLDIPYLGSGTWTNGNLHGLQQMKLILVTPWFHVSAVSQVFI